MKLLSGQDDIVEETEESIETTEPDVELSEVDKKYNHGYSMLNSTNKLTTIMKGYQLLQEAANEGSVDAKVEIAIA